MDNKRSVKHPAYQKPRTSCVAWFLIVSVCFNIGFLTYLVFLWHDDLLYVHVEEGAVSRKKLSFSDDDLQWHIASLDALSDEALLAKLNDSSAASHGYSVQELVLALLRQRDFLVEDPLRCLGKWPQSLSFFSWEKADGERKLDLFTSVSKDEIHVVDDFISKTCVPYTPSGIIDRITSENRELYLQALVRTDEWACFLQLFHTLSQEQCLEIAQELGGAGFSYALKEGGIDLSERLLSLFEKIPSKRIAEILSSEYSDYIVARGSDETVLRILSSLPSQSEGGLRLCIRLLQAQRKPIVWKGSQLFLAKALQQPEMGTVPREQIFDLLKKRAGIKKAVIHEPKKESVPVKSPTPSPAAEVSSRAATRQLTPFKRYIVKRGDSLWSVAKKFNVHVEKLKYLNGLKGTKLSPGMQLKIPH